MGKVSPTGFYTRPQSNQIRVAEILAENQVEPLSIELLRATIEQ